jgi:Family of unknown function (DUF6074)
MAAIYQFPRVRDRRFVLRHARRMALSSPTTAQKHLAHQIRIQRELMERRGVDAETIRLQLEDLEAAIRYELWAMMCTGGAA